MAEWIPSIICFSLAIILGVAAIIALLIEGKNKKDD